MNLLDSQRGRKFLFAVLYLSEGAPVGYIWWALPTQMRAAGVPVGEITSLTSLLILPWIFKAFWAPVVDAAQTRKWTLREWILSTQILMGLSLLPAVFLDFSEDFTVIRASLFLHAMAASIQDASIDSLAISIVPASQRGSLNGWMQTGYLLGRSVFGGLLLILSVQFGAGALIIVLIGTIWGIAYLFLVFAKLPEALMPGEAIGRSFRRYREHFGMMLRSGRFWFALAFALLAGAAFEGVGAVGGPYLVDMGYTQTDVGWFFSIPAVLGMIGGALAGGYLADRAGTLRAVGYSLGAVVAVVAILAGLNLFMDNPVHGANFVVFTLLYVCIGLFTASSYAMFMNLTDHRLGATQFSAYMGATNGCESWSGYTTGRMVDTAGYGTAFGVLGVISLLTLPILFRLHREEREKRVDSGMAEVG